MPGPRLCRPLHPPAHSGLTVPMTITHRGAAAHLVEEEEEGEGVSIPSVDWSSERENMLQKNPSRTGIKGVLNCSTGAKKKKRALKSTEHTHTYKHKQTSALISILDFILLKPYSFD